MKISIWLYLIKLYYIECKYMNIFIKILVSVSVFYNIVVFNNYTNYYEIV